MSSLRTFLRRPNRPRLAGASIWPWAAAVFVAAVWAETFVSSKIILGNGLAPADIFFYRFSLAYVFIWIISPKKLWSDSLRDELRMFLLGLFGGSLYFLAENTALTYSNASQVAIIVCCVPLLTALLVSVIYPGERMTLRQTLGSVAAFIGMALVVFNGEVVLRLSPLGDLLAFCAASVWAVYSILIREPSSRYSIAFITRKVLFYGVLTVVPYFIFVHPLQTDWSVISRGPVIWNLLYLGIIASMVCFALWNWALSRIGTVRATNLLYGQCLVTMTFASAVLGERITPMAVVGALVLILGMTNAVRR